MIAFYFQVPKGQMRIAFFLFLLLETLSSFADGCPGRTHQKIERLVSFPERYEAAEHDQQVVVARR